MTVKGKATHNAMTGTVSFKTDTGAKLTLYGLVEVAKGAYECTDQWDREWTFVDGEVVELYAK